MGDMIFIFDESPLVIPFIFTRMFDGKAIRGYDSARGVRLITADGYVLTDANEWLITTRGNGTNGDSIFKHQEPMRFQYHYRTDPFYIPFCLGDRFMCD